MYESLIESLTGEQALQFVRASLLLLAGFVIASLVSRIPRRVMSGHFSPHHVMLARRFSYYLILALFIASALSELGFSLGVLLGAAGVLSVAIGFASQTSVSNLISGLFLIGERPFSIGDVITVGSITGEVLSIDLLSVKLRTGDNLYVRIPNEKLVKGEVTTLTRYPTRRIELRLRVASRENVGRVREVLMRVAKENPLCLDEPKPAFVFAGFGDSSLDIQFLVWARREDLGELRNTMLERIKRAFDDEGIEIPFPHLTIETGEIARPFPVRLSNDGEAEDKTVDK